jgi:hypothetical protein
MPPQVRMVDEWRTPSFDAAVLGQSEWGTRRNDRRRSVLRGPSDHRRRARALRKGASK